MIDTCQAASMYEKFYSPNILAVASSLVGEDSLSHHIDPVIGVYIIDRYTYFALDFLEKVQPDSKKTMGEFVRIFKYLYVSICASLNIFFQLTVCPKRVCISTVGVKKDLFPRDPNKVPITDFFGSVRPVEITVDGLNVTEPKSVPKHRCVSILLCYTCYQCSLIIICANIDTISCLFQCQASD